MSSREEIINSLNACMDVHRTGLWSSGCMLCAYEKQSNPKCFMDLTKDVIELLKEQEAIVRCKDCKYAYLTSDGECKYCELEKDDNGSLIEMYRSWDWFCADGERR